MATPGEEINQAAGGIPEVNVDELLRDEKMDIRYNYLVNLTEYLKDEKYLVEAFNVTELIAKKGKEVGHKFTSLQEVNEALESIRNKTDEYFVLDTRLNLNSMELGAELKKLDEIDILKYEAIYRLAAGNAYEPISRIYFPHIRKDEPDMRYISDMKTFQDDLLKVSCNIIRSTISPVFSSEKERIKAEFIKRLTRYLNDGSILPQALQSRNTIKFKIGGSSPLFETPELAIKALDEITRGIGLCDIRDESRIKGILVSGMRKEEIDALSKGDILKYEALIYDSFYEAELASSILYKDKLYPVEDPYIQDPSIEMDRIKYKGDKDVFQDQLYICAGEVLREFLAEKKLEEAVNQTGVDPLKIAAQRVLATIRQANESGHVVSSDLPKLTEFIEKTTAAVNKSIAERPIVERQGNEENLLREQLYSCAGEKLREFLAEKKLEEAINPPGGDPLKIAAQSVHDAVSKALKSDHVAFSDLPKLTKFIEGNTAVVTDPTNLAKIEEHRKNTEEVIGMNRTWAKSIGGAMLCVLGAAIFCASIPLRLVTFGMENPFSRTAENLGRMLMNSGVRMSHGAIAGAGEEVTLEAARATREHFKASIHHEPHAVSEISTLPSNGDSTLPVSEEDSPPPQENSPLVPK